MRFSARKLQSAALRLCLPALLAMATVAAGAATPASGESRFRVVALAEAGGIHRPFVDAAIVWLNKLAAEQHFTVDYIENTDPINDQYLSRYRLFIQLNYPPYNWTPAAKAAFIKYIEQGRGGWIGFHHASLLGDFDGTTIWPWFSRFMGGIRWKDYIATFADADVVVEDKDHPVMKGVTSPFPVCQEEWYTWDKDPRRTVRVLATVDEDSYRPDSKIKMGGDHPVIWSNEHVKARNVYIFMGHHPDLFENRAFTTIFRNAIFWAAHQTQIR